MIPAKRIFSCLSKEIWGKLMGRKTMKKREITVMLLLAAGMSVFSSRPVFGKEIESMAVKSTDAEENRIALDDL